MDLGNASRDLSRYVIDDLMSPIRHLGLSRNTELSMFYYEDRLKKLNMELALLQNQAAVARQAFDAYLRSERHGTAGRADDASVVGVTHLGTDILDRLLEMSGRASAISTSSSVSIR